MLENEPFEKLPLAYQPNFQKNHRPPIFRLGFAIPDHLAEFRRVALAHKLGDPENFSTSASGFLLRMLVVTHINERCGLQPEGGVVCEYIRSKESNLLLEVATSYNMRISVEKLEEVLGCIREVFSLPVDAPPKWYLEILFGRDPDEYRLPSESKSISTRTI